MCSLFSGLLLTSWVIAASDSGSLCALLGTGFALCLVWSLGCSSSTWAQRSLPPAESLLLQLGAAQGSFHGTVPSLAEASGAQVQPNSWLAGHEVQSISVAPWSCHPSHGAISSGPGGALQLAAGAPAQRPACCCELTFGKAGNKPPSSAAGPSAPAFGCLSSSRRQTLLCCSCLLQICGLGPPKACQESRASGGSACQGRTGAEERPSRCCGRWRSPSACRALLPSHPLI